MIDKIKSFIRNPYAQQFRDIRFVGFIVFGFLVLLVTWSGASVIQTNYELQKKIAQLEEQNKIQELENANLKLKNEYYNTDQYLELTARRQFGLGAPGETLLIVPKDVALQHTVEVKSEESTTKEREEAAKPLYQRNLEAWLDFFFHRD